MKTICVLAWLNIPAFIEGLDVDSIRRQAGLTTQTKGATW